jgi:HEAT repeat protein
MFAGLLCVVALTAFSGCKGDPKTPEYWEKSLQGARKSRDRVRTLEELRDSGKLSPAFLPMLHKQLQAQRQPEVKASVARILGGLKDPSSIEPLAQALEFGNSDSAAAAMNREIADALGRIGDVRAVPTLLRVLKMQDHYVQVEAIEGLGALKAKEAVAPLMAIAPDDTVEPFVSRKALRALGDIGDPQAVPVLVKMMFKDRRGASFYPEASFALYQLGQPSSDALLAVLKGDDKELFAWARENHVLDAALYAKASQVLGDLYDRRAEKPLLAKLSYEASQPGFKLMVRMKAAEALGRMRTKEAVKPLSGMLGETEPLARFEYLKALSRIGGRDAMPALAKECQKKIWEEREAALQVVSLLGDERELPLMEKAWKDEEALTAAECRENEGASGCSAPAELAKQRVALLQNWAKRLEAARECKADADCWAKKLDAPDEGLRERAAYEVGRSGKPELVSALLSHLGEKNTQVRQALIQGIDWLMNDSPEAIKTAKAKRPAIEKQLAEEKDKVDFVKVNEDLKRLDVRLAREAA